VILVLCAVVMVCVRRACVAGCVCLVTAVLLCATVIFGSVFVLSPLLCVVVQVFIGGIETLGFGK